MENSFLIDTDVLIDYLRGLPQAVAFVQKIESTLHFSAITVAEIYSGIKGDKEEEAIRALFSRFPVLTVDTETAEDAGRLVQMYRKSHRPALPDALIAATCRRHELQLATLNTRHFPMFPGIESPYRK